MNSTGKGAWDLNHAPDEDDGLERVADYRNRPYEGEDPLATSYEAESEVMSAADVADRDDEFEAISQRTPGGSDDLDEDEPDPDDENAQFWQKQMGFPDQLGVVRVWVNDDVLIDRVRLSLQWRHRLGEQTLQQSFGIVFMLINNYHRLQRRRTLSYYDPDREASQPLSFDALDVLRGREGEVRRKLEALGEGGHPTLQGSETVGEGLNGRVQVKLNLLGQLAGVQFDPKWLPHARIKEISDGVVEAHAAARAAFVPAEVIVGEREQLVNELTELRNEALAMMRRGFY